MHLLIIIDDGGWRKLDKFIENFSHSDNPFTSVLIANRGEIACRIIRACRELGLSSVAVYAENDATSLFVEMADSAILLPGEQLAETYLNAEAIIAAAHASGAGAIHPGFGFLSERADFAQAVTSAGLVWVGPSPHAITSMGDKMTARIAMRAAGVPVIPGEEIEETDEQASFLAIQAASEIVGYPLLLKASAGGGGKGMRAVEHPDGLLEAAKGARREAITAFGDGRVYVERLLTGSRHIEIQVLADRHGNTIHLGERECSIQRRHQKVLEESPSSAVDAELREYMGKAAVAAAEAVDYEGAGTVEFLLSQSGEFFFLEMNTRIQVEHPITELVTGTDLVQQQLLIAAGNPISQSIMQRIPSGKTGLRMQGHAIEVRVYAENPATGFLPAIGPLQVFIAPEGPGVRLDTGVRQGDNITPNYDPMIAKLVVHAPDRDSAIRRMRVALHDFVILGCTTNINFLSDLLSHHEFVAGNTPTNFIDLHWAEGWSEELGEKGNLFFSAVSGVAESVGIHRKYRGSSDIGDGLAGGSIERGDPFNPFLSINRRLP